MAYTEGDILCSKLTGELVLYKGESSDGAIVADRPVMTRDGIQHEQTNFFPWELETEEEHLKREAAAVLLKTKLQKELQKQLDALDEEDKPKSAFPMVN